MNAVRIIVILYFSNGLLYRIGCRLYHTIKNGQGYNGSSPDNILSRARDKKHFITGEQ